MECSAPIVDPTRFLRTVKLVSKTAQKAFKTYTGNDWKAFEAMLGMPHQNDPLTIHMLTMDPMTWSGSPIGLRHVIEKKLIGASKDHYMSSRGAKVTAKRAKRIARDVYRFYKKLR